MTTAIPVKAGTNSFLMLDAISDMTEKTICGIKFYADAPSFLLLESMAQLAALHWRKRLHFSRHVFLLGTQQCVLPPSTTLTGSATVTAYTTACTENTATYLVKADFCRALSLGEHNEHGEHSGQVTQNEKIMLQGQFTLSSVSYSEQFPELTLKARYKEVYQCLANTHLATD